MRRTSDDAKDATAGVTGDAYRPFFQALEVLREQFHRIGRFDDANAKLDEVSKLFVLRVLDARHPLRGGRSRVSAEYLRDVAKRRHGSPNRLAAALHMVFTELLERFGSEAAAFGPQRGLNLAPDDDEFAAALLPVLQSLPAADPAAGSRWRFDGVSEAFGHFLQQSFQNRKEDAQYMTPPEVVVPLIDIALEDILRDRDPARSGALRIADPTCGVGSFLAAAHRRVAHLSIVDSARAGTMDSAGRTGTRDSGHPSHPPLYSEGPGGHYRHPPLYSEGPGGHYRHPPLYSGGARGGASYRTLPRHTNFHSIQLIGQDKVERMVRLANVNLRLLARAEATIRLGNSILPPQSLDDLAGEIDLIVTNPPFGATFRVAEILSGASAEHFPTVFELASRGALPSTLDSEYLLLDRELELLKPGGRLLMVVPDHLVSGSGYSQAFRESVLRRADLVAVIDLPSEAFAQAGTRTKTSVVYLRRHGGGSRNRAHGHVFLATADQLGFRVFSRSGATYKETTGTNDMDAIVNAYRSFQELRPAAGKTLPLHDRPSAAAVPSDNLRNERWTASSYRSERLAALRQIETLARQGFDTRSLSELAVLDPEHTQRVRADDRTRCISVLHVAENGCLDLQAVARYAPATACVPCRPGDLLLSRINPHLVRICVVPKTQWQLGCSPEFAVLRPKRGGRSPWQLFLLLRSEAVQRQIQALACGTSSSHHRIKNRDLASLLVPVSQPGTAAAQALKRVASQCAQAARQHYRSQARLLECLASIEALTEKT